MLDQFSLVGTLPRDNMCPAADFPARIERDMDLLLSLLGEFRCRSNPAVDLPISRPPN